MKDTIERMDKTIKEKFDDHEVPVPSHLWNSIESNLTPEKGNTGGKFFFNNPFMLSILFVGTVMIGTYVYNSSNTKTNDSTALLSKTNTSDNELNRSSITHSNNILDAHYSVKEKNQRAGSLSNQGSLIETGKTDRTTNSSSNIHSEAASNSISTKNKGGNNTGKSISETTTATISNENSYSDHSQNKSSTPFNKNSQHHTTNNNNRTSVNQSGKSYSTNTSSDNVFAKRTADNNTRSASEASTTKSNQSESNSTTSAVSEKYKNTAVQTSATATSKNTIRSTAHADSIKLFASAYMQQPDSFNKTESPYSNSSIDKNTLTDITKTNNISPAPESNQQVIDLNAAQISSAIASLNSTNIPSNPSETISLYNEDIRSNESVESASANKKIASSTHTHASQTFLTNTSIDSVNSKTSLENYIHTGSTVAKDTNLSFAANRSAKELLAKIDSTMIEQLDTSSILKQPETLEVKSNAEEDKKKKTIFLSRCSFDGYATPAFGYMHLYTNNTNDSTTYFTKDRNKHADPGFGFTTGLRMNYALTQKIEVGIGLQYSSLSQQSSLTQQHLDSSKTTYQGYIKIDSTFDQQTQQMIYTSHFVITDSTTTNFVSTNVKSYTDKFQNFSIPIHIAYGYSISNKLSLLARTSFLINYQISSTTYLNAADGVVVGYHSNKNLSLGGSFSIGCYYQFSNRCSVFAEPIVSYYFSNVFDKQVPFKQKQLTFGLQTGIRLSF